MAEGARVNSVESLMVFRAALIKFAEAGNVALSSSDSDIVRAQGWLERDQLAYWEGQVRSRHLKVMECEDAVRQKRLFKNIDGTAKSAVDEMKALQRAKQAEEEAIRKIAIVKRAIQTLRKETMMYQSRVQRLMTALQADVPRAVHTLDNMIGHIENYLSLQTAGQGVSLGDSAETISRAAASEKVGLERLRDRTPKPEDRQAAPYTLIAADHAMHQAWNTAEIQPWQKAALDGLSIERQVLDPEARIVLAADIWQCSKIYLERLDPTGEQDSGWYIGPATDEAPKAEPAPCIAIRMGDMIAARGDFEALLTLPTGSLIVLDTGGPAAIFDQLGIDIWAMALLKKSDAVEPKIEQPEPATTGGN